MSTRVKSLELQGYKTFATSTVFEFANTVTAIVGPNGSGKSNIVDALRWVLGEQSYSLLRGKKTEDMIFAGSEQRARSGMASATLTFNNDTGWLPIDFSEVAIARRAYRDGQNEYVLNGQRVRLKDVSELLSKSGLAERTYTIIGQGLVDAALSLKAEERRRLFEEAAGIGLYRSRREEALRRLENTQRNLERVHDILTELRPHMRNLERQAEKAREYDRMKAELRIILREWYGYHWHQAQDRIIDARETTRIQEKSLANSRREQNELDGKLTSTRKNITELRENINLWRKSVSSHQSDREKILRDIAVIEERIRSSQEQYEIVKSELARASDELAQRETFFEKAQKSINEQNQELVRTQLTTAQTIEELQNIQASRIEGEDKLSNIRNEIAKLVAQKSYLETLLAEKIEQAGLKRNELTTIGLSLEELDKQFTKDKVQVEDSRKELEKIFTSKLNITTQLDEVVLLLEQNLDRKSNANNRLSELINERDRLSANLELMADNQRITTGYGLGALSIESEGKHLGSGEHFGVLRKIIKIPSKYELAIAAALGDYLDVVILDNEKNLEKYLDILTSNNVRGALLPITTIKMTKAGGNIKKYTGVVDFASELIEVPAYIKTAVELLLGSVLVVENRKTANNILNAINQFSDDELKAIGDLRIATLEGEIFHLNGLVIGGLESRVDSLRIEKRQGEYLDQLKFIEKEIDDVNQVLLDLSQEIQDQSRKREELEKAINELNRQEELKRNDNNTFSVELDRNEIQRNFLYKQRTIFETDVKEETEKVRELKEELADINSLLVIKEALLQEKEQAIEKEKPLEELRERVTQWKTRLAVLERSVEDSANQIEERQRIYERAKADFEALQNRLIQLEDTKKSLEEKRDSLAGMETTIVEELKRIQALLEPAEQSLNKEELHQQELVILEAKARQALNLAEHQYAQARIVLAQQEETLETLKHRIEDDFGLVSFEYSDGISGPKPLPIEGMVEQLPIVKVLTPEIEENLKEQRTALRRLGAINPEAQSEYHEIRDRFQFLNDQIDDLRKAEADIRVVINELDELMQREFQQTFIDVADEFTQIFTRLFGGGSARLVLTNPDDLSLSGIDIEARLPGRREQGLSLLSGGERSLAATSLVFALLKVSPTPFCVLDEVDAMLDESNTGRFRDLLNELSRNTQFVVITHNRNTVQVADVIYGVTMGRDSSSQVISLKMKDVMEEVI